MLDKQIEKNVDFFEVLVAIGKRFEQPIHAAFQFSRHCTAGMLGGQGEVPVALKQLFNLLSIASCATWLATVYFCSVFELKKEKKEMLEMKDGCLKDAMESAVICSSTLAFADRVLTMD
ncbi:hypothetical protein T01_13825 [Trichinella spiralis]|uniref:Uncharacterized protein n=1 Tax=Trichinella spiralis TaxID=6334 RepID=A0A0V1BIY9_TRISP|nr:hypothetical protein T01_13825 [Trichinella spiralis]